MSQEGEKRGVRMSLRWKTTLIFLGLFVLLIAALWLINRFGLPSYYLNQQLLRLEEARQQIVRLAEDPLDEDLDMRLRLAAERAGITAVLIGENAILFSTGGDERNPWYLMEIRQEMLRPVSRVITQTEDYVVYETFDIVTRGEMISCLGSVTQADGSEVSYLLTLSKVRIEESSALSNRFLLLIGLGILVIGSLLMLLFTRRLTAPIIRLSALSRKMAALDFSERFQGDTGDEIQQLGENINELSENLEAAIGDLTKANQRLAQDIRDKEIQNERRKELLANISHELKTPIALIQGYAEGLRDGLCEDEELRVRYSDIIIDEAARMNRLVRQLLSLDELESGVAQIEKTRFDLAGVIRAVAASYGMQQEKSGARVELALPDTLEVESDELLTEQIVQNYVSNAFHYVREGGLIRLSAVRRGEAGALISVYNEGDRIPEEALPQVWNKFYKVDKARTRSYGGSGIGLSLVKASTERLGCGCDVKNTEDGVEFTAWF